MKSEFIKRYDDVDGNCENCGRYIMPNQVLTDCFPHFRGKRTMTKEQKKTWFAFTHWELHHYQSHKSNNLINQESEGGACVRLYLNKYSDGVRPPKPFWLPFMLERGIISHPSEFWIVGK